jgi:cobalt-zinc-cadmium resistance protein CzcA
MLSKLVALSIRARGAMFGLLLLFLGAGVFAVTKLPIDAMPDVSTIQVSALTEAQGLSPIEVERMVTVPIETAFNGVPGLVELRSVSRPGLSAVTVVFKDSMDVWFARQLVLERLREVQSDLPPFVSPPQLAPVSTGLGEIYTFVISSDRHAPMQLRTILDWDVVPKMRGVPGVIEVNTMGGELKQYQVVVRPDRLHAYGLSLKTLKEALERANASVGGGYVERSGETLLIRGVGLLANEEEIGNVVVKTGDDGTPILVKQVADVRVAAALRYGVNTRDGEGEVVTGTVMMLLGANSREVVLAVKDKVAQIQNELPPGVKIEPIYDRSDFVGRTLTTVVKNLIEGALVVLVVLGFFLGSFRGAIAVVLGIPASMTIAIFGMHLFGVTGDLMSLGAIDFGFLVDGPIIILEAALAALAGRAFKNEAERLAATTEVATSVIRPVVFSVAIIMLVYLPLFALEGIEGKMFRPMATVMACALFGAVFYSVVFFPAVMALLVPPPKDHGPKWIESLTHAYSRIIPKVLSWRWPLIGSTVVALLVSFGIMSRLGADFVPRIDEGDAVLTIRRAPSISLAEARELDLKVEKVLKRFPEVITSLAFTGRAELAFDPVGNDNTDMLVRLKPKEQWTTGKDLDELSLAIKETVEREVPGTFVSVSQPIEDRTNEMISGSRADVAIQLFGPDLESLATYSQQIGELVRTIDGAGDVRIERVLGMPNLSVVPDRTRLARYGARVEDVFETLEAARVGSRVGSIYEGQRRFDLRLMMPPAALSTEAIGDLFVETAGGQTIPLAEVASVKETEGPAQVRREGLTRTVRVEVNLRGRDLVSWVNEAKAKVAKDVPLPSGYNITWGGQFENFERAQERLALVVPLALAIIVGMLVWTFGQLRVALAVFSLVPLALIGGIIGLAVRGLTFSLPAAVGFIALAGVAVLNGVVMTSDVRKRLEEGLRLDKAIAEGAAHTLRAVLTTAAVAALGFLPMALSTGAGAEVQRPLATVVIFGIVAATVLMLFIFPGILRVMLKAEDSKPKSNADGLRPMPEVIPVPKEPVEIAAEAMHRVGAT